MVKTRNSNREAELLIKDNNSKFEGLAVFLAAECGDAPKRIYNFGELRPSEWDCPEGAMEHTQAVVREGLRPVVLILQPTWEWAIEFPLNKNPFFEQSRAKRVVEAHSRANEVRAHWGTPWANVLWTIGAGEDIWLHGPLTEEFLERVSLQEIRAVAQYGGRPQERVVFIGSLLAESLAERLGWEFYTWRRRK